MSIGITVAQCDRLATPAAVAAAVRAAEQLGYSSVWVCDSALDPAGVLSAAASVTSRVGLGAGIVVGPSEDPASLVRSLTTVDALSEGRLTVALAGPDRALEAVLDALGARVPVLLDGHTPATLDRVARRAAGWSPLGVAVDDLELRWATVQRLAAGHGRDPDDLRFVVRADVVLAQAPAGAGRASYQGDVDQVAGDIEASQRAGAHEVVLRLDGDLSLDQALDGYARIAEATELLRTAAQSR